MIRDSLEKYIHWVVYMTKTRPTRQRVIEAAGKLFHGKGIRAVSMDAVAEKAGVTKRTLYYHFRSKDDLIAAYMASSDEPTLAFFKRCFAEVQGDVADKVEGVFRGLARAARHPKWKGCGVLRTSAELVDMPGHPAMVIGRAHKKRVEDWLYAVVGGSGAGTHARQLARQVLLLLDGSLAVVLLHRDPSYIEVAGETAAQPIRGVLRR